MNKLSFFNKLILLINSIMALLLLCTLFNQFVSPYIFWWLSFLGLAFPFLIITNIFFIIYWIINKKFWFLLSLLIVGINFQNLQNTIAWGDSKKYNEADSTVISVMSYNVRVFDLYEWDREKNHEDDMLQLIKQHHPSIITFQEFYTSENMSTSQYNTIKRLITELGYKYFHFEKTSTLRKTDHWGIAIFSDYPIIQSGEIDFGAKTENAACYSDVKINGKIYRIINTHLQSVYFGKKEYKYLDDIQLDDEQDINEGKKILRKLKRGFIRRTNQASKVAYAISKSPYPVIVCGDFNDTPTSYSYHTIHKNLQDAFLVANKGIGTTYISRFPFMRIDYILTDKKLEVLKFDIIKNNKFSDHYPIKAIIKIN